VRPAADAATRRHRWVRAAGAVTSGVVRTGYVPGSATRRRKALVRSAADVLTALGVRVEVHAPAVAWPRPGTGRLVVANHVSWLDDLALLTVAPGSPVAETEVAGRPVVGGLLRRADGIVLDRARIRSLPATVAEVADRLRAGGTVLAQPEGTTQCGGGLGRFRPALFQAAVDAAAAVCPVAIRYRTEPDGEPTAVAGYLADDPMLHSLRRIIAARGLVVELHLLPALRGGNRRELAALSEYAVAAVTEARVPAAPRDRLTPAVRPALTFRSPTRPNV
jgi:1-acyl-sn-glycerol-3-phosphate acyltransferase